MGRGEDAAESGCEGGFAGGGGAGEGEEEGWGGGGVWRGWRGWRGVGHDEWMDKGGRYIFILVSYLRD